MKGTANYTVSAGVISQVLQYITIRGEDASKLLVETEMDSSLLNHPDERIRVEQYIRIEEKAAELLKDPCLGLHMGQYTQAGNWTILGYMMMNCQNVLEAFRKFTGELELIDDNSLKDEILKHPTRGFLRAYKENGMFKDFYHDIAVFRMKNGVASPWTMDKNFSEKEIVNL